MDPTGLIFGTIAVAWLLYFVPNVLSRKDFSFDVQVADEPIAAAMRMVRRSDSTEDITDDNLEVSTPYTRAFQLRRLNALARQSAARRRGILLMILATVIALAVTAILGHAPWWTAALSAVGLIGWLAASRAWVTVERDVFDDVADRIRFGEEEPTLSLELSRSERDVELSVPIEFTGSLWEPVPVTAPTYVQKPLAPRTVRTIDLSAPVPPAASTTVPPTAQRLGGVEPALTQVAADDDVVTQEIILPRAVGE